MSDDNFTKVYDSILDSSVWFAGKDVRLLWLTLLAMSDRDGIVSASLPALANRAVLTIDETAAALEVLMAPDPYDRSGVMDGARVVPNPAGWLVVNRVKYRDKRPDHRAKTAARVRKHREKKRNVTVTLQGVTGNGVKRCNSVKRIEKEKEKEITPPHCVGTPPQGSDPPQVEPRPKPSKAKPRTTLCDHRYTPAASVYEWAKDRGIPRPRVDEALQEMRDWSRANSRRKADWDAALRNWLRKDISRPPARAAPRRGPWVQPDLRTPEQMIAETVYRDDERIPDAEQF